MVATELGGAFRFYEVDNWLWRWTSARLYQVASLSVLVSMVGGREERRQFLFVGDETKRLGRLAGISIVSRLPTLLQHVAAEGPDSSMWGSALRNCLLDRTYKCRRKSKSKCFGARKTDLHDCLPRQSRRRSSIGSLDTLN